MTLHRCRTGEQLPADISCAVPCSIFPDCLPAPSPELVRELGRFVSGAEQQQASVEAVDRALSSLHDAITQGLARKEGS